MGHLNIYVHTVIALSMSSFHIAHINPTVRNCRQPLTRRYLFAGVSGWSIVFEPKYPPAVKIGLMST